MSSTSFISNKVLWETLADLVNKSSRVDAAIAYFGQGGARLLPLRRGSRLVVDMGLATVRSGATDPREIEKLVRRGVKAYTRRNLHAKIVASHNCVVTGSANVSTRSLHTLDEAAIHTTDQAVVRRARDFIDRLCTEPIRQEYLKKCKSLYRPPRFVGDTSATSKQKRAAHAKLWIVNLREYFIPDAEQHRFLKGQAQAAKLLNQTQGTTLRDFHWPSRPRMAKEIQFGDWVIQVFTSKAKNVIVYPPGRFLMLDHYIRGVGKKRYVFHLEMPSRGESLSWTKFRKSLKSLLRQKSLSSPRTLPIRDVLAADGLLRLWTTGGRVSKRPGK